MNWFLYILNLFDYWFFFLSLISSSLISLLISLIFLLLNLSYLWCVCIYVISLPWFLYCCFAKVLKLSRHASPLSTVINSSNGYQNCSFLILYLSIVMVLVFKEKHLLELIPIERCRKLRFWKLVSNLDQIYKSYWRNWEII